MRLLLTRPRSEAAAMAERLATLGHECLIEPLLEIWTLGAVRLMALPAPTPP